MESTISPWLIYLIFAIDSLRSTSWIAIFVIGIWQITANMYWHDTLAFGNTVEQETCLLNRRRKANIIFTIMLLFLLSMRIFLPPTDVMTAMIGGK